MMTKSTQVAGVCAFVLLLVGTSGLLANEFAFHWGRIATLLFAGANALGLAAFVPALWGSARGPGE